MDVHLLAIGTRMPTWVEDGSEEYCKRLAGNIRLHIHEIAMPKRNANTQALIDAESEALKKKLAQFTNVHTVALEVKGKQLSTEKMAQKMGTLRDEGRHLALLVGGPDGLQPALSASCDEQWSLSALTLPHPLVRVLLAEQVYRCWSLLSGHPYHR